MARSGGGQNPNKFDLPTSDSPPEGEKISSVPGASQNCGAEYFKRLDYYGSGFGGSGFRLPYVTTTERPEQPTIVIGGVAFKDWTFEGDVEAAVTSFPYRRGHQIQMTRIIPLVKRALESPEQDEFKVIEQLRQQVSALNEEDNQAGYALEQTLAPLSSFGRTGIIRMRLNDSLTRVKQEMLSGLKRYEAERASKGEGLQKWLTERKALYDGLLRKL